MPIEFRYADYREIDEPFDRIVSVGMFEHVGRRYHQDFFASCERCLKRSGLVLLHTVGFLKEERANPWFDKYILPGVEFPTVPNIVNVGGTWTGNETDRLGPAVLTWTLTQTGHDVTGSAAMRPVNATDGSCASCHKSKDGTIRGNVSGTTLTLVMFFPSGGKDDLTPKCSILLRSSA